MNLDKWTPSFGIIWKTQNMFASDGHFPFEIKFKVNFI